MSDPKSFIQRWSRRKRAAAEDAAAIVERAGQTPASRSPPPQGGRESIESADRLSDLSIDLTKLPPIESITAESDIRAFLAPGIPPELTRAALRRAWAADPKIRDFVGLSENS